jgi:Flp pilus assembly secretin CpaC
VGAWETLAMYSDIPIHEINIDAKFYETDTQNDLKLGLDWIAWKNGPGANLFNIGAGSRKAYVEDDDIDGFLDAGFRTMSHNWRFRSYDATVTAAYLDFLASKGKAQLLTEGSLTGVSGRMSSWRQADPVMGITVTGNNGPADPPSMSVFKNGGAMTASKSYDAIEVDRAVNYTREGQVGFFLNILPVIGTESTELFVGATLSEVNGLTPQGLPTVTESSIFSTVRVREGQQLALGGLTRTEKVKQKNGVPWLSDLPVLGYIFGGETKLDRKKNVIITLETTPCVGLVEKGSNVPLTFDEFTRLAALGDEGYDAMDCKGISLAAEDVNTVNEAMGIQKPGVPETKFGFDQWLIDPATMIKPTE